MRLRTVLRHHSLARRRPLKKDIWGNTLTEVSVVRKSASTRAEDRLNKYVEAPLLSLSGESFY